MKKTTKEFLFPIESNPVKWAGMIVGSWMRFIFAAGILSYATYAIVMRVAERGADHALNAVLLLLFYQLSLLYGLRWLLLKGTEDKAKR